jgi:hypothetical protein
MENGQLTQERYIRNPSPANITQERMNMPSVQGFQRGQNSIGTDGDTALNHYTIAKECETSQIHDPGIQTAMVSSQNINPHSTIQNHLLTQQVVSEEPIKHKEEIVSFSDAVETP